MRYRSHNSGGSTTWLSGSNTAKPSIVIGSLWGQEAQQKRAATGAQSARRGADEALAFALGKCMIGAAADARAR
jgi:hypothetical protein